MKTEGATHPEIIKERNRKDRTWWEAIKTGAYFNNGTGQDMRYTKIIIRRETYLRIATIIEDGEEGMDQLVIPVMVAGYPATIL